MAYPQPPRPAGRKPAPAPRRDTEHVIRWILRSLAILLLVIVTAVLIYNSRKPLPPASLMKVPFTGPIRWSSSTI